MTDPVTEWEREELLQTITDQARELTDCDHRVTCPCGREGPVTRMFQCYECEVFFCPECAPPHFGIDPDECE